MKLKFFCYHCLLVCFFRNTRSRCITKTQPLLRADFTCMMLQTDNPEAYINTLKSNDSAFKATGTAAAGYCLTKIGNNTPGDMFIWSGFPTLADALASSTKYDPMQSPDSAFSDLRVAKYSVVWKPLMPFKLAPGFERMIRVVVPQADRMEFVSQMSQAQQGLYDAGYKMNLGVFEPIGGGAVEANIIQVELLQLLLPISGKFSMTSMRDR